MTQTSQTSDKPLDKSRDKSRDKSLGEHVTDTARDTVSDMTDAAADRAREEGEATRDMAADEAQKTADAAHAAAQEFDPDSMQAQAIEQIATQVDALADRIRSTDIDRMARMVGDTAQRNPLMFVAGAALAGFAATRLLKARNPHHSAYHSADPKDGFRRGDNDYQGSVWRINEHTAGEV